MAVNLACTLAQYRADGVSVVSTLMVAEGFAEFNFLIMEEVQPAVLLIVSIGEYRPVLLYKKEGLGKLEVSPGLLVKFQCHATAAELVSRNETSMGDSQFAPLSIVNGLMTGGEVTIIF